MRVRKVVIVVFPGVQSLDAIGPGEVFAMANRLGGQATYGVRMAARQAGEVRTSSGFGLVADVSLAEIGARLDTLVVAGGDGVVAAAADPTMVADILRLAQRSRRVVSVCSGAFLLAEAGLLEGRRATTHWQSCDALARRYPGTTVEPDPIYVRDGNVYTSAGVTAGIDLALALVEDDLGRDLALEVARQLVLFLRRPANQAQLSAPLRGQMAERHALKDAQQWIGDHPEADLSIRAMAERSGMSERNFARCFKAETGWSPGRYVERIRIESARRMLEDTGASVSEIVHACGFGTAETMRRTFLRALGSGPAEYRRRFSRGAA